MRIRYRLLTCIAALIALTQFNPTAASVMEPERTSEIIAAQLHRRGVACTAPRIPARDAAAFLPHESVWTLRCDEAVYRVRLGVGSRRVQITPISIGSTTPESVSERREDRSGPCG
jgi:hypothetical protein